MKWIDNELILVRPVRKTMNLANALRTMVSAKLRARAHVDINQNQRQRQAGATDQWPASCCAPDCSYECAKVRVVCKSLESPHFNWSTLIVALHATSSSSLQTNINHPKAFTSKWC